MADAQKERQRVTAHLDQVSTDLHSLRRKQIGTAKENSELALIEDALFNILQALRLMQGENDE